MRSLLFLCNELLIVDSNEQFMTKALSDVIVLSCKEHVLETNLSKKSEN